MPNVSVSAQPRQHTCCFCKN